MLINNILINFNIYDFRDIVSIFRFYIKNIDGIKDYFVEKIKRSYGLEYLIWEKHNNIIDNCKSISNDVIYKHLKRQKLINYVKSI